MGKSKQIVFDEYRYQILPISQHFQMNIFDEIKSIDDLKHQPVKSCAYDSTFILELESPRFKTQICSDEACFIVKQSTL